MKRPLVFLSTLTFLVLVFALTVWSGPLKMRFSDLFFWNDLHDSILFQFRMPKAFAAILAGSALATAGLLMQTYFQNPLASPSVLGVTSGASLGAALALLGSGAAYSIGSLGQLGLVFPSIAGALAVLFLILWVSWRIPSPLTLVVIGMLFSYAVGAMVTFLMDLSSARQIQSFVIWSFGSFGGVTWTQLALFAPLVILGNLLSLFSAKGLDALLLGEDYAKSLGVSVGRLRFAVFSAASILAGGVTAFCGPLALIGLAVPHLARLFFPNAGHRILIPAVWILGAATALLAEFVSQGIFEKVLPLNGVLALFGAPFVIWIVLSRRALKGLG
ncbi:MAG: iron ABC transporter permease [Spirochaetia bacterium]|nr:iron ABC transporter permease [Spirochaetia bacterium]